MTWAALAVRGMKSGSPIPAAGPGPAAAAEVKVPFYYLSVLG